METQAVGMLRELLFCHDRPCGAATRAHKRNLLGNLVQKVTCLLHGAQVRTQGDLFHTRESQVAEGLSQLIDIAFAAKLTHKGRRDLGDNLFAGAYGLNHLENLALIGNGSKGAVDQALPAAHALVVIDLGAAVFIGTDRVHATSLRTRAHMVMDGLIRAHLRTASAFDALAVIDKGFLVLKGDGALGANLAARVG